MIINIKYCDKKLFRIYLPSLEEFVSLRDLFNLSTTLVWNLFSDEVDAVLGGEEDVDLTGDCRLDCEFLEEFLEYLDDIAMGVDL